MACKPVNRHVWAVHEVALRSKLSSERDRLVDVGMEALEAACLAKGNCAIVVLRTNIAPAVLKRPGYVLIIERSGGAWFQKHLSPERADLFH